MMFRISALVSHMITEATASTDLTCRYPCQMQWLQLPRPLSVLCSSLGSRQAHRLDSGAHEIILNQSLLINFHTGVEVGGGDPLLREMRRQFFSLLCEVSALESHSWGQRLSNLLEGSVDKCRAGVRFQELEQKLILVILGLNSLGFESKAGDVSQVLSVCSLRTYLGRYTDVLKTPSSEMSKA